MHIDSNLRRGLYLFSWLLNTEKEFTFATIPFFINLYSFPVNFTIYGLPSKNKTSKRQTVNFKYDDMKVLFELNLEFDTRNGIRKENKIK